MEKPLVLVVDDEVDVANEIARIVKKSGEYTVDTAYSGEEALAKLRENNYAVMLLDIRMPKMSGLDLLKEKNKVFPGTEVIMLTAFNEAKLAWDSHEYGAFDYITKPFDNDALLLRISLAAKRVKEREVLTGAEKSIYIAMKMHEHWDGAFEEVLDRWSKWNARMGRIKSLMDPEDTREWFTEEKLKEIFKEHFNPDWVRV